MQVADTNFLTWAKGRLSGVTVLLIYPCQSIGDRVAQHDLTAGMQVAGSPVRQYMQGFSSPLPTAISDAGSIGHSSPGAYICTRPKVRHRVHDRAHDGMATAA